jgi:hypothetical protein
LGPEAKLVKISTPGSFALPAARDLLATPLEYYV